MRAACPAAGAIVALMLAACASTAPTAGSSRAVSAARTPRAAASASARATAPPAPEVVVSQFRSADGAVITVARFAGAVSYRLHSGSEDPGAAALSVVSAGPTISGPERSRLLAAFNGGFLLAAGAGGYEQEGHVISRLRPGLASLVIDRSGAVHIGVWGAPATARRSGVQCQAESGAAGQAGPPDAGGRKLDGLGSNPGRRRVGGAQRTGPGCGWRAHLRRQHGRYAGGHGGCARECWCANGHGARHQPRMGPAGRRPGSGPATSSGHPWPGPPIRPVPGRMDARLHHGSRLADTAPDARPSLGQATSAAEGSGA